MFRKAFDVVRAVNKLSHSNLGSRTTSQSNINGQSTSADHSRYASESNVYSGGLISRSASKTHMNLGMTIDHLASNDSLYSTSHTQLIPEIPPDIKE